MLWCYDLVMQTIIVRPSSDQVRIVFYYDIRRFDKFTQSVAAFSDHVFNKFKQLIGAAVDICEVFYYEAGRLHKERKEAKYTEVLVLDEKLTKRPQNECQYQI